MELRSRTKTTQTVAQDRTEEADDSGSESFYGFRDDLYRAFDDISSQSEDSDSDEGMDLYVKSKSWKRRKKSNKEKCVEVNVNGLGEENGIQVEAASGVDDVRSNEMKAEKANKSASKKEKQKPVLMWHIWEEENNKWVDENSADDFDLDKTNEVMIESAEAPACMVVDLLRYQKEWLAWALRQESSKVRGGILADEMGMGKTVQAIALVLAKRELSEAIGEALGDSSLASSSTGLAGIKATLVICPVVAVSQWVSEIDRFTSKGSAKVLVYHGTNREKSSKTFSEYDFVITTYSIVENEFRKYLMPPKEKCPYCGKLFYEKQLTLHWKYICGPNACKTEKQSKQTKKNSNSLPSSSNKRQYKKEANIDFSFASERPAARELPKGKSILHAVKWERIILDEAHYIKARHCNTAKAVLALESKYKWALSGTPIQNRVGELYSLIRFLQLVPYSFYFCKDCDCRLLDHSSAQCSNCPHSSVRHFCWWNKFIATPIKDYGNLEPGKRAMIFLKHKILKSILLRRTKKGRAADLALPPRIVSLRRDTLDIREQDYYESLYNDSQAQFNTYVQAGTVLNNYAHIFDLLTRLRQAVDHPYLVVYSATSAMRNANNRDPVNAELVCGICHDPAEDHVVTNCEHVFCKACLLDYSSALGQVSCPTCSKLLTVDLTSKPEASTQTGKTTIKGFRSSSILNRVQLDDFQTSTKIEALREEIRCMVERDGSAKGIVFSQFTSFLDLINYSLQKSGIKCVQLVGSMTMNARDLAIKKFIEDPDCKIFLMSLKAGGVALNLTVASHVFLMDPWWNPAVERQAQDRIHRIGQFKPIRIIRFIIENSIEERILKLQEKKELVFEGTVGGSSEALGKLTEADLKFLFIT